MRMLGKKNRSISVNLSHRSISVALISNLSSHYRGISRYIADRYICFEKRTECVVPNCCEIEHLLVKGMTILFVVLMQDRGLTALPLFFRTM